MSFKRQLQYKYAHVRNALLSWSLPSWLYSRIFRFVLIAIIAVVGCSYIVKTTASATSGYDLHTLEKKVGELQTEIQKVEIRIADNSSIRSVRARLTGLRMTEIHDMKYLTARNTAVARE